MAKILVAEDDDNLALIIQQYLAVSRYVVEVVRTGNQALDLLTHYSFDAAILDLGLPGLGGFDVLSKFRETGSSMPILVLTAQSAILDKEKCFNAGADDYLTKPFEMRELVLRLGSLLRRSSAATYGRVLSCGPVSIHFETGQVYISSKEVELLASEYNLLEFLMRFPNHRFSAEDLLNYVWTSDSTATRPSVTACIARLRRKLSAHGCPDLIVTDFKKGYRLQYPINDQ